MVIVLGVGGAAYIKKTAPKARKRPPARMTPLVQVLAVHPGPHRVWVPAMGGVIPARVISLEARVSGEVVASHPEFNPGGLLKEGEEIVRIDPEDYKLALEQKKSAVADAEYALKVEQGHQDVALREWELLNGNNPVAARDAELALRKPHMAKARADLAAALAELKQAELNLERTSIHAPFNAVVRAKHVDYGSQVSPQDPLAELAGTDAFWIRASIPVDRLSWITIPRRPEETGSQVRVFYRNGYTRTGTVIRLMGDLEEEGRMARVLVEVKDPVGLKPGHREMPPLLLGEYVEIEVEGKMLQNVYRIPRTALRDNSEIWIATEGVKLEIRNVETLWRDARTVLLRKGLQPGDRLIVSDLPMPVNGMPVQVAE
jgi:RND family efflux transporter MFP subunit